MGWGGAANWRAALWGFPSEIWGYSTKLGVQHRTSRAPSLGGSPCPDPAAVTGEMAVPYYMGRASDWVAREDELVAILPMVLLGLSRYWHGGGHGAGRGQHGTP